MVYDIEFIRDIEGKAEALALEVVSLVGSESLAAIIHRAEELYHTLDTVPRPDGYRIRENCGEIIHEFHKPQHA